MSTAITVPTCALGSMEQVGPAESRAFHRQVSSILWMAVHPNDRILTPARTPRRATIQSSKPGCRVNRRRIQHDHRQDAGYGHRAGCRHDGMRVPDDFKVSEGIVTAFVGRRSLATPSSTERRFFASNGSNTPSQRLGSGFKPTRGCPVRYFIVLATSPSWPSATTMSSAANRKFGK